METILDKRGRDRLYILAEIQEVALEGVQKTELMYKAGLSYTQLIEYTRLALDLGLLELVEKDGKHVFKTTEKGLAFLRSYRKIHSLIRSEEQSFKYQSDLGNLKSEIRNLKNSIESIERGLANSKQCSNCRREIFADSRFCPYCGREQH